MNTANQSRTQCTYESQPSSNSGTVSRNTTFNYNSYKPELALNSNTNYSYTTITAPLNRDTNKDKIN